MGGTQIACLKKKKKKWPYLQCGREEEKVFVRGKKEQLFHREPTSVGALKNPVSYTYNCVFEQLLSDFQRALRPKTG